jgi:hypothetical protein
VSSHRKRKIARLHPDHAGDSDEAKRAYKAFVASHALLQERAARSGYLRIFIAAMPGPEAQLDERLRGAEGA